MTNKISFQILNCVLIGQRAQVGRPSFLVREVRGLNPELIKYPTRCQRLTNLEVWALEQSRGDGHHSLVTPERVLSEYNEDMIF